MLKALIITIVIGALIIYSWFVAAGEADVRINVMKNRDKYCDGDCKFCNSQDTCNFKEGGWD